MNIVLFGTGPDEDSLDEFFTNSGDAWDYASAYEGFQVFRVTASITSITPL